VIRELTVSGLFADISKAGVETEPRLLEVVGWRETRILTDGTSVTHADRRVVERSVQQRSTSYQIPTVLIYVVFTSTTDRRGHF